MTVWCGSGMPPGVETSTLLVLEGLGLPVEHEADCAGGSEQGYGVPVECESDIPRRETESFGDRSRYGAEGPR